MDYKLRGNQLCCLQDIAMNGCSGVTGAVWQHLNAARSGPAAVVSAPLAQHAPQHALQSLSLVGCKGMRACLLGLMPSSGWDILVPGQTPGEWLATACHLSGLSPPLHLHWTFLRCPVSSGE